MGFSFSGIIDKVTGNDVVKKAEKKAADYRQQAANIKNKSTTELQQEGRQAAGQAAVGKAAEAKKAAKAATMQSGGNRLQAATNAASAASEGATSGFDASSQAYTQMAGNIDVAEKNAQRQALEAQAQGEEAKANRKRQQQAAALQAGVAALGQFASSDETKKKVKHTYIPADQRVKRGDK